MKCDDDRRAALRKEIQIGVPDDVERGAAEPLKAWAASHKKKEIERAVWNRTMAMHDVWLFENISERLLDCGLGFGAASTREHDEILIGMRKNHRPQKGERISSDPALSSSRQVSCVHAYSHR